MKTTTRRGFLGLIGGLIAAPFAAKAVAATKDDVPVALPAGSFVTRGVPLDPDFEARLGRAVRGMVNEELARQTRTGGFLRQRNDTERNG